MLTWPTSVLPIIGAKWEILSSVVVGQANMAGIFQAARFDGGGQWALSFSGVQMNCPDAHRAFRALQAALDGGVEPIEICVPDWYVAPTFADYNVPDFLTFDDGSIWGDGAHWENSQIMAQTVGAAAARATSLVLDMGLAQLRGGERFSIMHAATKRQYQIKTAAPRLDGAWDVTFRPPLRAATPTAAICDFNRPTCTMRSHVTDAGSDPLGVMVDLGRWASPAPAFIEWFDETDGSS